MKKLSKQQINEIAEMISGSSIKSRELKEDLTDHICCLIEDDMEKGLNYEEAESRAIKAVFPDGIEKNHKKDLWLITPKKQKSMKSILFILSYLALVIMTGSFVFKALHWPGAGTMLIVASSLFTFVFTPVFFMYIYRVTLSKFISRKSMYVLGFIGIIILLTGVAFKAFHWPYAAILLGLGVLIISFFFLPLIFLALYRKSGHSTTLKDWQKKLLYLGAYLSSAFFLIAAYLKLLHWPGSAILLVTSIFVLNFVFLPLLLIKLSRDYAANASEA
ncbi:MAG: hypothetical protein RQ743_13030 [Bacteroidales bacterium]|nr:hypothetical protein [Bacteroidales bacterium]